MKATVLRILKNLAHPATIIGIIVSLTIPFLVYWAPNHGHKDIIQLLENKLPLPLFAVQFVAIVVFAVILRKDFREWFKSILPEKKISILMVLFTIAISIFAGSQIEARHRVQSDESVFMSVAQNMYYNQASSTCNQGYYQDGNLECVATSNSFKTKGLSFLYTIGMPLFGKDLHWIFNLEFIFLPLAVLLMFLAVVAWTKQPLLAFFAALLTALQPTVLFQFRAMSVEPLYILLSALSLFVFNWAFEKNTWKHWTLLALILAFFAQTRQETVFCFAPFIIFALPKLFDVKSAKAPLFFVLLSLFSVPILLTISAYQGFGFQGGEFEAHGHFLEDVKKNWEVMTLPIRENGDLENPFLTYFNYIFAAGGIYLIIRAIADAIFRKKENDLKKKDAKKTDKYFYLKLLVFIVLYHIQTYVILENVSGDFSIQINQRYSLVMIPTMAFLAALPIAHIITYIAKFICKPNYFAMATAGLALLTAIGFTGWTFHYKDQFNKNIMYNRNHLTIEEHEILDWLKEQPQKDRLFIYGRPWHFIGYGVSSIHYNEASRMTSKKLDELVKRYEGEVYYIRGLDCWDSQTYHKKAVERRIASTCDIFERDMDMVGVKNILITNNYWVQIAKFNGRKDYNLANVISVKDPQLEVSADSLNPVLTLNLTFSLKEKSPSSRNWSINVMVNGESIATNPYMFGDIRLKYPAEKLQPGFNTIRYIVADNARRTVLADIQNDIFQDVNGVKPLMNLTAESYTQGWGSLHTNQSVEGNPLKVAGKVYSFGLGTHAPSNIVYNLDEQYKTFKAAFGLDEESLCSDGVQVQIIGDDKVLFETKPFSHGHLENVTVNIERVKKLRLNTLPLQTNNCDHVDILNPVLIP